MRLSNTRRLAAILGCAVASMTMAGTAHAFLGSNTADLTGAGVGGVLGLGELLDVGGLLDLGNLLDLGSLLSLDDILGGGLGVLSSGN